MYIPIRQQIRYTRTGKQYRQRRRQQFGVGGARFKCTHAHDTQIARYAIKGVGQLSAHACTCMHIRCSNTHSVVIAPIYWGGEAPLLEYWGGNRPPCPPSAAAPAGKLWQPGRKLRNSISRTRLSPVWFKCKGHMPARGESLLVLHVSPQNYTCMHYI